MESNNTATVHRHLLHFKPAEHVFSPVKVLYTHINISSYRDIPVEISMKGILSASDSVLRLKSNSCECPHHTMAFSTHHCFHKSLSSCICGMEVSPRIPTQWEHLHKFHAHDIHAGYATIRNIDMVHSNQCISAHHTPNFVHLEA